VIFEITFDVSRMRAIDPAKMPRSWRRSPAPISLQRMGDAWAASGASAILQVPSAIVPNEWNYLLNPAHPDFAKISVSGQQPIKFDPRLVKISPS
jgi:RES domain-containing protein